MVPDYVAKRGDFSTKGVDAVICATPNDSFVAEAWAKDQVVGDAVDMLADGNVEFNKALGLDLDLSGAGMGVRSKRYSALIVDGVIEELNVEEQPNDYKVSDPTSMLEKL